MTELRPTLRQPSHAEPPADRFSFIIPWMAMHASPGERASLITLLGIRALVVKTRRFPDMMLEMVLSAAPGTA